MNYPINPDEYIAAVREAGIKLSDWGERLSRKCFIPLVNDCYVDGLQSTGAFPIDPDEIVEEFAQYIGRTLDGQSRNMMRRLTEWCNDAYAQGQQAAKEAQG